MADLSDPRRDYTHDALQYAMTIRTGVDDPPDGALVTGWVVVAELMASDGERWLSRANSSSLPVWSAKGLHHEALYGDWTDEEASG